MINIQSYKVPFSLPFLILALLIGSTRSCTSLECAQCDPNQPEICYQCQPGFYLYSYEGQVQAGCLRCSSNCQQCINDDICISCATGSILIDEQCQLCPSYCLSCQVKSPLMLLSCNQCALGFYSVVEKKLNIEISVCTPCLPLCLTCNSYMNCERCIAGYGFNSLQGECQVCSSNCISCTPLGCTQCETQSYPTIISPQNPTSSCAPCPENCLKCTSASNCTQCGSEYFSKDGLCVPCTPPCETCLNESICLKCDYQFYLAPVNDSAEGNDSFSMGYQCLSCMFNCLQCTNDSSCDNCFPSFYYSHENSCEYCGNACVECTDSENCISCYNNHYLSNGKCQMCPEICIACNNDAKGDMQCSQCVNVSYFPHKGVCTLCSQFSEGCKTCLNETCLTCDVGYYILNGYCEIDNGGLATVYIVLISIAGVIGVGAIVFGVWACWRSRNGYGVMGEGSNADGVRASYYQIP